MSIIGRALAGAVAGAGRGITAEHQQRVEAQGLRERRAWEAQQRQLDRESADARAATQTQAQLDAANIRADATVRTAEIGAESRAQSEQARQEQITRRVEIEAEIAKASGRRKEDLGIIEMLSSGIDEETGEEIVNPEMFFALRDGLDKFGEVPHPQEAAAYLASSPNASQRVWPRETSYDWDDIEELAADMHTTSNMPLTTGAMEQIRDQLKGIGAQVPDGRAPQEDPAVEVSLPERTEPIAPTGPSGPMPGATSETPPGRSHIQRRIQERRLRRQGHGSWR